MSKLASNPSCLLGVEKIFSDLLQGEDTTRREVKFSKTKKSQDLNGPYSRGLKSVDGNPIQLYFYPDLDARLQ